ncbi:MAG: hypothetical protein V3T72_09675 [Thermoanaerobaculia bacterium]
MTEMSANGRPPYFALAVAAVACLVYLQAELSFLAGGMGFPLDDSWIHLQFARQLAAGDGLAYHPGGAWVSGSTSPLWTALLAAGFLLPSAVAWSKLLGCVFFLATVDATRRLAAALGLSSGPQHLAALLVAATHWLVWSALSGLEIGLFAWLSLWGIIFHLRERAAPERPLASLAVFAAAALARPEGYLLLALAVADRWPEYRRKLPLGDRGWLAGIAGAAVILAPTLLFYRFAGGSFLPTTFAVKAGSPVDLLPDGRYLGAVVDILFGAQPLMLLLAGAGVLRLADRPRCGWLPATWPLGLALTYSLLTPPGGPLAVGNFGRYYFPVLPVVVVLGVLGMQGGVRQLAARRDFGALSLRGILVVLALAPPLWSLYRGSGRYLQTIANVEQSDVAAARWLDGRLPPEAVLAVQDIGALKYFLPNPVIDLAGIVNPEVVPLLKAPGPVYWEQRLLSYLETRKPDFLVVFPRSYPGLTSRVPGFEKVRGFEVPQNVTMAGDELAIFTTPWTRFDLGDPDEP